MFKTFLLSAFLVTQGISFAGLASPPPAPPTPEVEGPIPVYAYAKKLCHHQHHPRPVKEGFPDVDTSVFYTSDSKDAVIAYYQGIPNLTRDQFPDPTITLFRAKPLYRRETLEILSRDQFLQGDPLCKKQIPPKGTTIIIMSHEGPMPSR